MNAAILVHMHLVLETPVDLAGHVQTCASSVCVDCTSVGRQTYSQTHTELVGRQTSRPMQWQPTGRTLDLRDLIWDPR